MVRQLANNDTNKAHFYHKKNNQMKRTDEDTPTHQLTVNLEYDNTKFVFDRIVIFNDENNYRGFSAQDPFTVAEGTYDIYLRFYSINSIWMPVNYYLVVKEGINVNEDTSITISPEEATNKIDFKMLLPNGEEIKVAHHDPTQFDENGTWVMLEPGNVSSIWLAYEITKPQTLVNEITSSLNWTIDSTNCPTTLYTNTLSDKYTITCFVSAIDFDHNIYTNTFETKGDQTKKIVNNHEEYTIYEQLFSPSEYSKTQLEDVYIIQRVLFGGMDDNYEYEGLNGIQNTYLIEDARSSVKVFCGKQPNNIDYDLFAKIAVARAETRNVNHRELPWGETVEEINYTCLHALPIFQRKGTNQRFNFGRSKLDDFSSFATYLDETNIESGVGIYQQEKWELHPVLSYLPNKIKGIQGDNVPIVIPQKHSYYEESSAYVTVLDPCYLGSYGEFCESDIKVSHTNIKVNGEELIDQDKAVYGWAEGELSGTVDITMTNRNRKIDGLQGQNLATIHYDRDQEDSSAPVLQMLHFKDGEGYITDRFETSEGALMELFAGDFNEGISESNWLYFDRAKAKNVNVAYAPYGKDNWTDLTLEENPEYYSNLMGWYYAASLENVTGAAEQGWFDLKIRLEDESGNWQEQIVSPAFQIKSLVDTGIENMEHPTWNMEHAEAVYDVVGRHVGNNLSTRQLANSSTCNKGIRIVRKANGDVRKVVAK